MVNEVATERDLLWYLYTRDGDSEALIRDMAKPISIMEYERENTPYDVVVGRRAYAIERELKLAYAKLAFALFTNSNWNTSLEYAIAAVRAPSLIINTNDRALLETNSYLSLIIRSRASEHEFDAIRYLVPRAAYPRDLYYSSKTLFVTPFAPPLAVRAAALDNLGHITNVATTLECRKQFDRVDAWRMDPMFVAEQLYEHRKF